MNTANTSPAKANRLINETSPYLLQHAYNPVDWYPWGEEALQKAKRENKPILLSIGYSACHWCHVMAHESFEDEQTAQVMNALYVCVKVDREERPDLDKIYQFAHQVLTQRGGGWPLTVALTPGDQTPFFAGTYFPRTPKYGMPTFVDILKRIAQVYQENTDEVSRQNQALLEIMQRASTTSLSGQDELSPQPLDEALRQLRESYDEEYKGFGQAPKFPHPTNIERLLRHWDATAKTGQADQVALAMALETLTDMASGGLFDQLGGGFCRYSVDAQWMIPHFEKMLYDNGPLLSLYCDAWQITHDNHYQQTAMETAEWVMREMQSPQGGYYCTLDADSEGEEGKFYVWDKHIVKQYLESDEYAVFAAVFGLDKPANFEGQWHLHTYSTVEAVAAAKGLALADCKELLNSARQKLFRLREDRVHPGKDEKILVSWNGLMIKGMAAAGRVFAMQDYIDSAQRAVDFIQATLWRDNRLLATYKDGKAHLMAYLDDYVFLLDGVLELLQARWRESDLLFAMALADTVLSHFYDHSNGGFYFTADDHEQLIQRPKVLMDEAIPAGNGIAAHVLLRLGHLLGEMRYLEAAEKTLCGAWESIERTPYAHNALLSALEEYLYGSEIIVIRGEPEALTEWQNKALADYAPKRLALAIPSDVVQLPGLLQERKPMAGTVAYVCSGQTCQAPVSDYTEFERLMSG
ncbi:MAG: thioredoxin [Gammaproteobacteria bacterium SG8_11]|nr:MAG: thioredoxin [Gammaproteobacteria bacterium SG8_11]